MNQIKDFAYFQKITWPHRPSIILRAKSSLLNNVCHCACLPVWLMSFLCLHLPMCNRLKNNLAKAVQNKQVLFSLALASLWRQIISWHTINALRSRSYPLLKRSDLMTKYWNPLWKELLDRHLTFQHRFWRWNW